MKGFAEISGSTPEAKSEIPDKTRANFNKLFEDAEGEKVKTPESNEKGKEKTDLKDFFGKLFNTDSPSSNDKVTEKPEPVPENTDNPQTDTHETTGEEKKQDNKGNKLTDFFYNLFSDDSPAKSDQPKEAPESDNKESEVEKTDPTAEKISRTISTPEGIKDMIDEHPEKSGFLNEYLEAVNVLNDPDASPTEIRSAQIKLNILKGQVMELATKDVLKEAGFDVDEHQHLTKGESGGTRPDVVGVNNTDHPIEVFGKTIQPGETLSVECKCGSAPYLTNQLNNHIPNQLSGQEGTKILLTTSDVKGTPDGLVTNVCDKYDAKLVPLDASTASVENAIKEVAKEWKST